MMCTLSSLMIWFLGRFSWLEEFFFIMMSWIAWIHGLVGACDSDEVTVQDYFLVLFISSWFGEDGFYDAMGDLVP